MHTNLYPTSLNWSAVSQIMNIWGLFPHKNMAILQKVHSTVNIGHNTPTPIFELSRRKKPKQNIWWLIGVSRRQFLACSEVDHPLQIWTCVHCPKALQYPSMELYHDWAGRKQHSACADLLNHKLALPTPADYVSSICAEPHPRHCHAVPVSTLVCPLLELCWTV